jgi:nucleotide-binding universal stress UspA family protein
MDSVKNEPMSRGDPTATRAEGNCPDRRPLRLLVGGDGGPGSNDALALAEALARSTDVEVIVAAGDGVDDLKELAAVEAADLIVLSGATDLAGPQVLPQEADASSSLDGAPCAAVVVPPGLADSGFSVGTIAIGYDGSRAAALALDRAADLSERTGASLLILGAVEVSIGVAGYETRQPMDMERMRMEGHLRHAVERVPSAVSAESRLLFGRPARALVEAVEEADLLVLGSRGSYTPHHRLALGSVAAEVLRSAPIPTLVTPDN